MIVLPFNNNVFQSWKPLVVNVFNILCYDSPNFQLGWKAHWLNFLNKNHWVEALPVHTHTLMWGLVITLHRECCIEITVCVSHRSGIGCSHLKPKDARQKKKNGRKRTEGFSAASTESLFHQTAGDGEAGEAPPPSRHRILSGGAWAHCRRRGGAHALRGWAKQGEELSQPELSMLGD